MLLFATVTWLHYMFMIPLGILSVFLVLVILVQRGRGGGLTGALGGMGGQSAFGTKAGDLFTRVTIVVAAIWVILSMASLKVLNQVSNTAGLNAGERGRPTATTKPGEGGLLPSATTPGATPSGETPAEKPADDQPAATPATTKTGTEAEVPAAPTATPPAATEAPAPSSPAPTADAKPAEDAKP